MNKMLNISLKIIGGIIFIMGIIYINSNVYK